MRGWWRVRGMERQVSRSMVALVVSLVALGVLGLSSWLPAAISNDIGVQDVEPGLFQVAQNARGVQSLGEGLSVSLYDRGFRLARGTTVLADTVTGGSPVVAVMGWVGEVDGRQQEHVRTALNQTRIDAVSRSEDAVTYAGVVHDGVRSSPLRLRFTTSSGRVHMSVTVEGSSALYVNLDARPGTRGIAPALPERNLRKRAWWVDPSVVQQPTFTWLLGTDVYMAPVRVPRAVDLRQDGRIVLHVWSSSAVVTVTDTPRAP
ncbi:MAG: hypothetical protein ABIQ61_13330 [Ornithinibacter sp.]